MGSGKTTLIKEICKKAKVTDHVNSPTFSIVNEYYNDESQIIYHFDCYRIENIIQAKEIGFEEYLASENLCLIEWPEKVKELLLPYPTIHVRIEEINNHKRKIQILLPSNEKEK